MTQPNKNISNALLKHIEVEDLSISLANLIKLVKKKHI